MNKLIFVIFLAILWLIFVNYGNASQQPTSYNIVMPSEHKFDGDCTGNETMGRCADKSPYSSDTTRNQGSTDLTSIETKPKVQVPPMDEGK